MLRQAQQQTLLRFVFEAACPEFIEGRRIETFLFFASSGQNGRSMHSQNILGIGIDSIEINRFAHWHTYSQKQLLRVFSTAEITYCLQIPAKSAERFAVRFAAREALLKALSQTYPEELFNFLALACQIEVVHKTNGAPQFSFKDISINFAQLKIHLSLCHTQHIATAFVIISSK